MVQLKQRTFRRRGREGVGRRGREGVRRRGQEEVRKRCQEGVGGGVKLIKESSTPPFQLIMGPSLSNCDSIL
jgi:hypothetical protein